MRVSVRHRIDRLADKYETIRVEAPARMDRIVKDNADLGRDLAKTLARDSAGKHGKHYPNAITSEATAGRGLFGNTHSAEYGPDVARPQGGMSFEFGSRNQKPHLDLARSADVMVPSLAADVRKMMTELFR